MKPMTIDRAFGSDIHVQPEKFREIAEQIRAMQPKTMTVELAPDAVVLLEFMQAQCTRRYDELQQIGDALQQREADVAAREQAVALKARLVDLAVVAAPARQRRWWPFPRT